MDEDIFNMQLRKFLKNVGITSQREIETAVRDAIATGKLSGDETVDAVGKRIFQTVLDVASGKQTNSEKHGLGTYEFVPWALGAVV